MPPVPCQIALSQCWAPSHISLSCFLRTPEEDCFYNLLVCLIVSCAANDFSVLGLKSGELASNTLDAVSKESKTGAGEAAWNLTRSHRGGVVQWCGGLLT